jgi:hypothetical protein
MSVTPSASGVVMQKRPATSHRAGLRSVFAVLWLVALVASPLAAEQPSIGSLAERAYIILPHHLNGSYGPREGIWSFNLDTGEYERLTPFDDESSTEFHETSHAYLAAREDTLIWEGWPGWIEFELPTARLLRRYYPLRTPELYGWMLQGPAVPSSVAAPMGLTPGMYGFPICAESFIGIQPFYNLCQPHQFPGAPAPLKNWSGVILQARSAEPDRPELTFAGYTRAHPDDDVTGWWGVLTLDAARQGFWRGSGQHLWFYPVTDGQTEPPSVVMDPIPPLFGSEQWDFRLFVYHPSRGVFLAVVNPMGRAQYFRFVQLDRDLHVLRTYVAQDPKPPTPNPELPIPSSIGVLPGTLPSEYVQTVPIVAHTSGVNGTFWTSELWFYNPSVEPMMVRLRRVAAPNDPEKTIDLPAHGSLAVADALAWAGGGPGGDGVTHDAFVITSPYRWGAQLAVASRSSTPSSDPTERAAGGTLGHAVPAVPGRTGYTNHLPDQDPVHIGISGSTGREPAHVVLDLRTPGQYRHNLGVVNDSDQTITVTLRWGYSRLHWDEVVEGSVQSLTVPPHRAQITNIEQLFPAEIRAHWPPKIAVSATQPAIIWMSMMDNRTGDGTLVPFTNLDLEGDNDKRAAIPAVAHLPGENGTFWTTDLYGPFWDNVSDDDAGNSFPDQPRAWFHPAWPASNCGGALAAGGELSTRLDGTVGMPLEDWIAFRAIPGFPVDPERLQWSWRTVYPDVIHLFPECAADGNVRGALEVRNGSWMTAYARNYTTRSDGGTFGGLLPLYPWDGWPVQHFAGIEVGSRYRINLGLYNGNKTHAITHRLSLYAADGTLVAERELTLQPWENLQDRLERLLGLEVGSLPEGIYGLTVLPLDDPAHRLQGRSWAYVALVDNVTGDPTHLW